jgi:hypothetical protein
MTSLPLVTEQEIVTLQTNNFSAEYWLAYFQKNKASKVEIRFASSLVLTEAIRLPLIKSLQRFQIGETGEGKHLKKFASTTNNTTYEKCIDLFVKEEQSHAGILAQMIQALDGELISWHWSDLAFIALRRMLGLKTEVLIVLIAEIIGKAFYKLCATNLPNTQMSDAFSLVVLDEIGHLEFHCAFLNDHMRTRTLFLRKFVQLAWGAIFYSACLVFITDHRKSLRALNTEPGAFFEICKKDFARASKKALAL